MKTATCLARGGGVDGWGLPDEMQHLLGCYTLKCHYMVKYAFIIIAVVSVSHRKILCLPICGGGRVKDLAVTLIQTHLFLFSKMKVSVLIQT